MMYHGMLQGSVFDPSAEVPPHLRGLIGTRSLLGGGALYREFDNIWKDYRGKKPSEVIMLCYFVMSNKLLKMLIIWPF
jgi:hypothetical protein